ncbi:MAG: PD40 domain-containing protein [Bacteroidetes bacterium]|nr:PD40 domain-containing protein [Bacteroidota bacterium]
MKYRGYIFIFFYLVFGNAGFGQSKDSSLSKPLVSKDDILKAKKRHYTYIVSDRLSTDDRFDIFKITPTAQPPHVIIVRGHIEVLDDPKQKKARITVYNASNNERVGIFVSNGFTGNYVLVLVANVKYIFHVEVPGYGTMTEEVEVPQKIDYEICQQQIKVKLNEKKKPVLVIANFFNDENEKVFYIKASGDTVRTLGDVAGSANDVSKTNVKQAKNYSTIDEMVKKQVEEERKKPADALKAFKANDFETAASLYEALLKNDQGDPFANYYYGISLFKLNRSKARAVNSLQLASTYKEVPPDVFLYLGKVCHSVYIFQDAIVALEEYKKRATPVEVENNHVAQLIRYCKNGSMLMSDPINIQVEKRMKVQEGNLLATYNNELTEGRLMYKTDFFNSVVDKKKGARQLVCNLNKREYIHASFGAKEQTGSDLYKNVSLPSGSLSPSQQLGPEINTPLDEDYPYITKDGLTLYFSSKGHNSMGGFDIFKCSRPDISSPWSSPENLGYPINSTYDDILYIPDSTGKYASFCSNRKINTFELLHIKVPEGNSPSSIIKGNFTTSDSIPLREALISVYNTNNGEIAGVYRTNAKTGMYLMVLPSGTKFDITVSAENYPDLNSSFEIPSKKNEFTLKQKIILKKLSDKNPLVITNYFREDEAAKVSFDESPVKETIAEAHKPIAKKDSKKKLDRTPEEKKKDQEDIQLARKLYDESNFQEASLVYEELSRHLDLDPLNSYYYGMALFKTRGDKGNCARALEVASAAKGIPVDVHYYLGKSNHLNYRFDDAVKSYTKFLSVCKPDEAAKLNIAKEIEYCNNGIKLVNNPVVMEVHERKHVDIKALQNSLTHAESGAKVLVLTEDMRSSVDKKKNFITLLFLSADKNTLLYSSYGEDESKGKDIYRLKKLSNGKWSPVPENITAVNSDMDEEFPALSKDGNTLYFSSKGYENMGGYDIFKSTWSEETGEWSKPVNMGSPINSPYDDVYFLE